MPTSLCTRTKPTMLTALEGDFHNISVSKNRCAGPALPRTHIQAVIAQAFPMREARSGREATVGVIFVHIPYMPNIEYRPCHRLDFHVVLLGWMKLSADAANRVIPLQAHSTARIQICGFRRGSAEISRHSFRGLHRGKAAGCTLSRRYVLNQSPCSGTCFRIHARRCRYARKCAEC